MNIKKTDTFIENDIVIDGKNVGNVELNPDNHEIARLVIYEPYQNQGYGTQVVKQLVSEGYKSLWVRSDNPRAIHVYQKCGFVKYKETMFEMRIKESTEEPEHFTLQDAIKHCWEKEEELRKEGCEACADEHRQLAEWLEELQMRRDEK